MGVLSYLGRQTGRAVDATVIPAATGATRRLTRGAIRAAGEHPLEVGAVGAMAATGINPFASGRDPQNLARQAGANSNLAASMYNTILQPKTASASITGARRWFDADSLAKVASAASAAGHAAAGARQAVPDMKQLLLLGAGLAAAAEGVGAVRSAISAGVNKVKDHSHERSQGSRWAAVVKVDPTLAKNPDGRKAFNIIDRASPYLGSEPTAAASLTRRILNTSRMSETGGLEVDPKELQSILNIEKTRTDTRRSTAQAVDSKGLSNGIAGWVNGG